MHLKNIVSVLVLLCVVTVAYAPRTTLAMYDNTGTTAKSEQYSNYTLEQLIKLVEQLQARIKELKSQKECVVPSVDLSLGDGDTDASKTDVKKLQEFLRKKGFFTAQSTGFFGKITRAALMSYQASVGVPQTGEFDSATRAKTDCTFTSSTPKNSDEHKSTEQTGSVSAINVTVSGKSATWTVSGNAPKGFKLVYSQNPNPEYPSRSGDGYQYYSDPATRTGTIDKVDGKTGTYYVRVCEYLGGACGVYSNQVTTTIAE